MTFTDEASFEKSVIDNLKRCGWDDAEGVIKYPTEQDLIGNWARILFNNNRERDRLNDCPLTSGEMRQIMEQIADLRTPLRLNAFINGKTVSIIRDNPDDKLHLGKSVSMRIYDRREIAGGRSRYQIVRQPKFNVRSEVLPKRRGDLMLLINGMPVIHIELKKSGVRASEAYNQIEKYAREGVFTGLFSLVQVFVAMNPDESFCFANPGPSGEFNRAFRFHWADFNNEPKNDYRDVVHDLLSIPMAHQLIGFYTVADAGDGALKVMRSYQYYAASAISNRVAQHDWSKRDQLGGYIWHTTGSGKTMTSFKSAQLIADSGNADKVVFLMDRIELGTQSVREYRGFAGAGLTDEQRKQAVQDTENTAVLRKKLKSDDPAHALIVTSIQKMSMVNEDDILSEKDLAAMQGKRIVFIIDECHRSTFGDMLAEIKRTFPGAMFFGFTGTPIYEENNKSLSTTAMVFGDELHRYSIADGIRDGNVLGFDPYMVMTFKDADLRRMVGLERAKAQSEEEAFADPAKKTVYLRYLKDVPMAGYVGADGAYVRGIEDYVSRSQYDNDGHRRAVVQDIVEGWTARSVGGRFHAMLATSSIAEAIEYYRLFKELASHLQVTAQVDPNIDNTEGTAFKEEGLEEILTDYNARYGQTFTMATYGLLKRDIASRLAHKDGYGGIPAKPEERIDLLIVVDQMLTGFDSKWVNTLYLDKVLRYEGLIQAFSRTNRVFNNSGDKTTGTVRYYRYPHTMRRNVEDAFNLYSGDKPQGLFASKLEENLDAMAFAFSRIAAVFEAEGIEGFVKLPESTAARAQFAKLYRELSIHLKAAKIQGFTWEQLDYSEYGLDVQKALPLDQRTYAILAQRYEDLSHGGGGDGGDDVPYDIDPHLTEVDTGRIDTDYMNSRFEKWLKALDDGEDAQRALEELHRSFATLSQEDQRYAEMFLTDVQSGEVLVEPGRTFREYIEEYREHAQSDRVSRFAATFGLDGVLLREILAQRVTEANINEFGRLDRLKESVDMTLARSYFEECDGASVPAFRVSARLDAALRAFILGTSDFD
ncbi:DEAD/DEAH box helicase [Enorma massiliensis]|uniref:Type I restriction enzyme endonuclease subunit n=1 Tax=Enorma massiliensis TaxID=1472761 RepID=A0A1Y3UAV3_9ACTN|nr:DEAD/DEAH box helicase [Enorma massiliensis]